MTPNELVLTFGGLHVCVQFGENRRRNATVRVSTDGQTHTRTHGQTQNDFIICPMLYAIAMGQIIRKLTIFLFCNIVPNNYAELSSVLNAILLYWPRLVESVMFRSGVRLFVCMSRLFCNVNRARGVVHTQRDSPGGSKRRGQHTFPSDY